MLRSYPTNSPEAAGRVLAMALFSDGRCSAVELDTLAHEVVVADGHLAAGEAALGWWIRCGPAGTAATSTSAPETVSSDRSPLQFSRHGFTHTTRAGRHRQRGRHGSPHRRVEGRPVGRCGGYPA
jgi:hypothetical protein